MLEYLWKVAHTHFLQAHDPEIFFYVIFLGLLQGIIAVDSGYLAVKSIGQLAGWKKTCQILLLSGTFIAILVVTTIIARLNDQNQWESEKRAEKAEDVTADIRTRLTTTERLINTSNGALEIIAQNQKNNRDSKQDQAAREEIELVRKMLTDASRLADPARSPMLGVSPTISPIASQPTPEDAGVFAVASVQERIKQTQKDLQEITTETSQAIQLSFMGLRGEYVNRALYTDKQLLAGMNSVRPQIETILRQRSDRFKALIPRIREERKQTLDLLGLSPLEERKDKDAFDAAIAESTKTITIGASWPDNVGLYQLNYSGMDEYLQSLLTKLAVKR